MNVPTSFVRSAQCVRERGGGEGKKKSPGFDWLRSRPGNSYLDHFKMSKVASPEQRMEREGGRRGIYARRDLSRLLVLFQPVMAFVVIEEVG